MTLENIGFSFEENEEGFTVTLKGDKAKLRARLEAFEAFLNFQEKAKEAGHFGGASIHEFLKSLHHRHAHHMHGEHGHDGHCGHHEHSGHGHHGFRRHHGHHGSHGSCGHEGHADQQHHTHGENCCGGQKNADTPDVDTAVDQTEKKQTEE